MFHKWTAITFCGSMDFRFAIFIFQWILVTKKGFHVWCGRGVGLNCFSTSFCHSILLNLSWRSDRFLPGFLFRHSFFQSKYQPLKTTPHPKQLRPTNQQKTWNRFFWANCSDLSRGHPKWWYTKGIPPKMPLSQVLNYSNFPRFLIGSCKGTFGTNNSKFNSCTPPKFNKNRPWKMMVFQTIRRPPFLGWQLLRGKTCC